MAINFAALKPQINPLSAINVPDDWGGKSRERQQLALMREKFEEEKRHNQEDERLRRISEAGEMRRAEMTAQNQQKKAEADALAKSMEERRAAAADFEKYRSTGDYEGQEMAARRLNQAGGLAERLGEDEGGLPTWRIELDAEAARKADEAQQRQTAPGQTNPHTGDESLPASLNRLSALGYGTLGARDALPETAPLAAEPLSTEGAFARAGSADDLGEPRRVPDATDNMGGVPMNNADMGALNAQTLRRLDPALGALQQAYPDSGGYRDSAGKTAEAVAGMGLPADKALDRFQALRPMADAAVGSAADNERADKQLDLDERKFAWEQGKEGKEKPLSRKDIQDMRVYGEKKAEEPYNNLKLAARVAALDASQTVFDALSSDDPNDDEKAVNALMRLSENVGPQSDADAERVTGEGRSSFLQKVDSWVNALIKGGYDDTLRKSMMEYAQRLGDRNRDSVYDYISNMSTAADGEQDDLVANGIRGYVERNIPSSLLERYRKEHPPEAEDKKPAATQGATATPIRFNMEEDAAENGAVPPPGEFDEELQRQASEAGLDAGAIKGVIGPESGGNPGAVNARSGATGLIQFLPSVAKSLGTSAEELATMSAVDQIPYVIKYLKRSGLTAEHDQNDYYVGLAAPAFVGKPDDTVVYKKGSKAWEDNPLWRPKDGGDITVGDIKAYGGGGSTEKKSEAKPADNAKPAKKPGKHDDEARALFAE